MYAAITIQIIQAGIAQKLVAVLATSSEMTELIGQQDQLIPHPFER